MEIARNRVVVVEYTMADADGKPLESSAERGPMVYLHGRGNMLAGVENALAGRQAGDEVEVTVPPEQGFGPREPGAVHRVPIKHLFRPGKLAVGQVVRVNTTGAPRQGIVLKVGRFNVDLDFNHPLAGKTLNFSLKVVEVRDASKEEIAHGHAHGPAGDESHGHDHADHDHDHDHGHQHD